jgi:hypothetical protein
MKTNDAPSNIQVMFQSSAFKIRRKRMSVSDNITFRLSKSLIPNVTEQLVIYI